MLYIVVHKYNIFTPQSFTSLEQASEYLAARANTQSFVVLTLDVDSNTNVVRKVVHSEVSRYASAQNVFEKISIDSKV